MVDLVIIVVYLAGFLATLRYLPRWSKADHEAMWEGLNRTPPPYDVKQDLLFILFVAFVWPIGLPMCYLALRVPDKFGEETLTRVVEKISGLDKEK